VAVIDAKGEVLTNRNVPNGAKPIVNIQLVPARRL
jgi:hypothetical protein